MLYSVHDIINQSAYSHDPLFRRWVSVTVAIEQQALTDRPGYHDGLRLKWQDNGQYKGALQVGRLAGIDAQINPADRGSLAGQVQYANWFWPKARRRAGNIADLYYLHNQGVYASLDVKRVKGVQSRKAMGLLNV